MEGRKLIFFYHDDEAQTVALAGDFNAWRSADSFFRKESNGIWRAEISALKPGRYGYKVVVNGTRWTEDPCNAVKMPDNFGGLNSVLNIA